MNNKYILWFVYSICIIIGLYLVIFYSSLTLPSLILSSIDGDQMMINNTVVLISEIILISLIGGAHYYLYKRYFFASNNVFVTLAFYLVAILLFLMIGVITFQSLAGMI